MRKEGPEGWRCIARSSRKQAPLALLSTAELLLLLPLLLLLSEHTCHGRPNTQTNRRSRASSSKPRGASSSNRAPPVSSLPFTELPWPPLNATVREGCPVGVVPGHPRKPSRQPTAPGQPCSRKDPLLDVALLILHPGSGPRHWTASLSAFEDREALVWLPPGSGAQRMEAWGAALRGVGHLRVLQAGGAPLELVEVLLRAAEAAAAEVLAVVVASGAAGGGVEGSLAREAERLLTGRGAGSSSTWLDEAVAELSCPHSTLGLLSPPCSLGLPCPTAAAAAAATAGVSARRLARGLLLPGRVFAVRRDALLSLRPLLKPLLAGAGCRASRKDGKGGKEAERKEEEEELLPSLSRAMWAGGWEVAALTGEGEVHDGPGCTSRAPELRPHLPLDAELLDAGCHNNSSIGSSGTSRSSRGCGPTSSSSAAPLLLVPRPWLSRQQGALCARAFAEWSGSRCREGPSGGGGGGGISSIISSSGAEEARWGVAVQYFRQPGNLRALAAGLRRTLEAAQGAAEVVVVDDSSSELEEWVESLGELSRSPGAGVRVALLVASNDIHEIRAYNAAARLARAELLALLQDDDDPGARASWLEDAGALMESHPGMALLGGHRGRLDCGPGGVEASMDGKRRQADGLKFGRGHLPIPTVDPATRKPFMFAYKVNAAPLVVRRQALLESGGLLPALSCPGEAGIGFDFELSVRMWADGRQVGLFDSGFDRLAHGGNNKQQQQQLTSGTRKDKAKHRVRIANYHRNNQELYGMFPGLHHREGTLMALEATRRLPRAAPNQQQPGGGSSEPGSRSTSRNVLGLGSRS